MCDGDVFKGNVELFGALEEVSTDSSGDLFSLSNEFGSVELGDDGFEDFISNGGKDSFIVVGAEILWKGSWKLVKLGLWRGAGGESSKTYLINLWQSRNIRPVEHSECQAYHLQILTSGCSRDVPWASSDVVNDCLLKPWNQEMCTLFFDLNKAHQQHSMAVSYSFGKSF